MAKSNVQAYTCAYFLNGHDKIMKELYKASTTSLENNSRGKTYRDTSEVIMEKYGMFSCSFPKRR
ncbi:MAG: hypothetical protein ABH870_00895 [bacterium]